MSGHQYSIDQEADGSRIILMCQGHEIGLYDTVEDAARAAAEDALEAYPEAAPDVVYDVAASEKQMVDDVKDMEWFVTAVAKEISEDWLEFAFMPSP